MTDETATPDFSTYTDSDLAALHSGYKKDPENPYSSLSDEQLHSLHAAELAKTSSTLGATARGAVRGVGPALTGAVGTGLGAVAGGLTSPVTGPVGPIAGAVVGGYEGAKLGGEGENWLLDKLPESARKALGQDPDQIAADTRKHEIAAGIGEFAPQLAVMGPGKLVGPAAREGASLIEKVMTHPVGSRVVGAGLGAGQVAGGEAYEGQDLDPTQIALGAGAGALLNKPTKFGERLMMMPGEHAAPQTPPTGSGNAPTPGEIIGVPQPDGTVQHHFVEGVDAKTGTATLNPMTGEDATTVPISGLNHVPVDAPEQIEIRTQRASQLRSEAEKEGLTDAERNSLLAHADRLDPAMPTSGGEFVRKLTNPDDFLGGQGKVDTGTEKPIDTPPEEKPTEAPPPEPPVEKPIETPPVEPPPVEPPPVEKPPEVPPEEKPPAEKPVEPPPPDDKPVEKPPEEKPPEVPPVDKPVDTPPDEKPTEPPPPPPKSVYAKTGDRFRSLIDHFNDTVSHLTGKVDPSVLDKVSAGLDWLMERGNATGFEHRFAIDPATGETIEAGTSAKKNQVAYGLQSQLRAYMKVGGIDAGHGHPSSGSFSDGDLANTPLPGVRWEFAVGHDGTLHAVMMNPDSPIRAQGPLGRATITGISSSVRMAAGRAVQRARELGLIKNNQDAYFIQHEMAARALDATGHLDYRSTRDMSGYDPKVLDDIFNEAYKTAKRSLASRSLKTIERPDVDYSNPRSLYTRSSRVRGSDILAEIYGRPEVNAGLASGEGLSERGPAAHSLDETASGSSDAALSNDELVNADQQKKSKRYLPPSIAAQKAAVATHPPTPAAGGSGGHPPSGGGMPPIPGGSTGPTPHTPPPGTAAGKPGSQEVYNFSRSEEDNLFRVRGNNEADAVQGLQYMKAVPKEVLDPKLQEKFYFHKEDGDPLTPHEKVLFDRYVQPLMDAASDTLNRLRKLGLPVTNDGYVHRIVKGMGSTYDKNDPQGAHANNPMYSRSLSKSTSGAKSRTLFMAEGDQGTKRIVGAEDYKVGDSFVDNGEKFDVRPASTREVEAHSDVSYYHNALVNTMENLLRLRAAERNAIYLEHLKQDPTFQRIAQPPNASKIPAGWVQTKLPQFNGWRMDPKFAHVLDDFYGERGGDLSQILAKANHLLVSGIFLNPVSAFFGHGMNVATHWFVDRGWENFMPQTWGRSAANGMRAIRDVANLNQNYINMMRQGSALMYAPVVTRDFTSVMNSAMAGDIQKNPSTWGQIAKSAGLDSPVRILKGLSNISSKGLWYLNDVLMLQRVYDLQSKGLGAQAAIKSAEKGIPNYRIPAEAWNGPGGRAFSEMMQNSNLTIFGRYRYGVMRAYAETLKGIASKNSSYEERMNGIGQMLALGALVGVLYPMADSAVQSLTGNKDASVRKSGPATLIDNARAMSQNEKQFTDTVSGLLAPAPATLALGETFFNRQLWNGQHVYNPNGPVSEKAKELGYYGAQQFPPMQEALQMEQSKKTPAGIAAGWVGVRNPPPGQKERTSYYNQKEGRTESGRWQRVENKLLAPFRQNGS